MNNGEGSALDRYLICGTLGAYRPGRREPLPPAVAKVISDDPEMALTTVLGSMYTEAPRRPALRVLAALASFDNEAFANVERARAAARRPSVGPNPEVENNRREAEARFSQAVKIRTAALENLKGACRTPHELFEFIAECQGLRGWGPQFKAAISYWYMSRPIDELARILAQGQLRHEGWTSADLLKLAHPSGGGRPGDRERMAAVHWAVWRDTLSDGYRFSPDFEVIRAVERARRAKSTAELVQAIASGGLTVDMLPTPPRLTPEEAVAAAISNMEAGDVLRHADHVARAVELVPDADVSFAGALERGPSPSPMSVFLTKQSPRTASALRAAFYSAIGRQRKIERRVLIAIDVARDRLGEFAIGGLICREVAAAYTMVMQQVCVNIEVQPFYNQPVYHSPNGSHSVEGITKFLRDVTSSGASLLDVPIGEALARGRTYDAIITLTAGHVWSGHQAEAMDRYRTVANDQARFVCWNLSGQGGEPPPAPPGRLDIMGVGPEVPTIISSFIHGQALA